VEKRVENRRAQRGVGGPEVGLLRAVVLHDQNQPLLRRRVGGAEAPRQRERRRQGDEALEQLTAAHSRARHHRPPWAAVVDAAAVDAGGSNVRSTNCGLDTNATTRSTMRESVEKPLASHGRSSPGGSTWPIP